MLLFLDTADIDQINDYAFMLHGVTTTPTIVKRDSTLSSDEFMNEVRNSFPHLEIHVEALAHDHVSTVDLIQDFCTRQWYDADKVVFKVPISRDGIKTAVELRAQHPEVKLNIHMIFSTAQSILAMNAKPAYIAPLIGRYADKVADLRSHKQRSAADDAGLDMLHDIQNCKDSLASTTHILASSIRSVHDFAGAIAVGVDAVTLPPRIIQEALLHPMTDEGVQILWDDMNNTATK